MLGGIGTFLLGGLGWIAFAFIGQPLRKFWDLRGDVSRAVHAHARFVAGSPETDTMFFAGDGVFGTVRTYNEPRDAAMEEFKSLGLQLVAFDSNEFLARAMLRAFKFDGASAGNALVALALALEGKDAQNAPTRADILKPLRLD